MMMKTLSGLVLAIFGGAASAQSCSISSSSLTTPAYDPFGAALRVQGSVNFSCSRAKNTTRFPATFLVGVSGTNPRNLVNGADTLAYSLFTTFAAPCSGAWQGTTYLQVTNTAAQPTNNNTLSTPTLTGTFCLSITAPLPDTKPGIYTAAPVLTITDADGFTWLSNGSLNLSTTVNPSCAVTTAPSILTINYVAFGPAQSGTSTFGLRCTNSTSFDFSLNATTGTLLGLPYTLSLPAGGIGSGVAQNFNISGNIPANQPGICSAGNCSANETRQLTVTY